MSTVVSRQDPRFESLKKGNNLRWPASASDEPGRIEVCRSADDAAEALQKAVRAGLRPTVRSGGHCYEDFVSNNPGGVLLDLSLLKDIDATGSGHTYKLSTGMRLGDAYTELYKQYGVTLPGGSCYAVSAGGHISGGGYGVLSRLHGLTVDWLSAVDILTVNSSGTVVPLRVDANNHPDLFRACRGAGGQNFGIITAYYYDKMPTAPRHVASANMGFAWDDMTPERFEAILTTYGHFHETRAKDPDTWGMFTFMGLSPRKPGGHLGISAQFCNPDGGVSDLAPLNEFVNLFRACDPVVTTQTHPSERHSNTAGTGSVVRKENGSPIPCYVGGGTKSVRQEGWFDSTVRGGVGGGSRAKYKSCYMKKNFTSSEARAIYKHLTIDSPGANGILAVDSYGGAVNRPELAHETSIPQRASVMKLQFQSYWNKPEDDASRLKWMDDFFTELYSGPEVDASHKGTPWWGDFYEGCYINYPDADMLRYSFWPELYYGQDGLYPFLQKVKQQYDANNIFHHAMAVRP